MPTITRENERSNVKIFTRREQTDAKKKAQKLATRAVQTGKHNLWAQQEV